MLDSINNSVESPNCVVMLHGFGANKNDLFGLQSLFPDTHVISLQAPLDLSMMGVPGGRAWFNLDFTPYGINYHEEEIVDVVKVLKGELESLNSRFEKVILLGFSQGCILTHGLMLQNPDQVYAAICLSGRFADSIFLDELKDGVKNKRVFISHGLFDEVIPISSGREIMNYYKNSEADATIKEYEMGHEINPECGMDVKKWFDDLDL